LCSTNEYTSNTVTIPKLTKQAAAKSFGAKYQRHGSYKMVYY
jgi:hypothetical protein